MTKEERWKEEWNDKRKMVERQKENERKKKRIIKKNDGKKEERQKGQVDRRKIMEDKTKEHDKLYY